jgi:hypothetical protein
MGFYTVSAEVTALTMFIVILSFLGWKRKDYWSIAHILSGSMFGITLEYANVYIGETYTYSREFLIQVGAYPNNIPIVIGLSWGLIIWACMNVSNRFNLPFWARSILDGLLALTIDLSMDTIAIRLDGGFWNWHGIPLESLPTVNSFFGVNYGNFTGWFYVVVIFSVLLRFEKQVIHEKNSNLLSILYLACIPFLAYIPLYLILINSYQPVLWILDIQLIDPYTIPQVVALLAFLYTLIGAISFVIFAFLRYQPEIRKENDWGIIYVFLSFHVMYILFFLLEGLFEEAILILPLAIFMFIVDIIIHWKIIDLNEAKKQVQRLLMIKDYSE